MSVIDAQQVQLDRLVVAELTQTERTARDTANWDLLADCYHADSRVRLSWIDGTGAEFAEGSKDMYTSAGRRNNIHLVSPATVWVNGDRAIADAGCTINMRPTIHGVQCDIATFARHRYRAERRDGVWRLRSLEACYQKDCLTPTRPGVVPELDWEALETYRESYRYLSYYCAHTVGRPANQELPGMDRPELVEQWVAEHDMWLTGA